METNKIVMGKLFGTWLQFQLRKTVQLNAERKKNNYYSRLMPSFVCCAVTSYETIKVQLSALQDRREPRQAPGQTKKCLFIQLKFLIFSVIYTYMRTCFFDVKLN